MADYSVRSHVNIKDVNPSVTEKLGQLQATRNTPLSVTSGYRSPSYNAKVGGAKNSQHTHRNAIDLSTHGMTQSEVRALAQEASRLGFNGIGIYNGSLHFDVRSKPAVWGPNYSASSIPAGFRDFAAAHVQNKFQGTSPAPAVAKVERQQLPAVGPVPEARPQALASVAAPTAKPAGFAPGGVLAPTKIDVSKLSPVSGAYASPAQAAPAPSMAQSPAAATRTASPAPNPSRFGPSVAPNINEANALKSALQAQAAQISQQPTAQNVSAISSLRSLAPEVQAKPAQTKAFSPTPASYQTPAFSTAQPKLDAYQQSPAPGIQRIETNPYGQVASLTPGQPAAPALSAPRTIRSPTIAAPIDAQPIDAPIDAPAPNPALDQFPDRPKPGFGLLSPAQTTPAKIGQITGALLGTAVAGPVGGIVGGLLGKSGMNRFGGGLLDPYSGPTTNVGSGLGAVQSVMGGGLAPGSTATASNGQQITSLPGGGIQRYSPTYGWTEITTADGRTTRAKSTRGAGGNYGGVKSEKARDAIDKGIGGLF